MTQATGLSYSTVQTLWTSSTSVLVVDIYTLPSIADGVPTPAFLTQEWWSFGSRATSFSVSVTLASTNVSVQTPTATVSPGMNDRTVAGISIATALVGGILGAIGGLLFTIRNKRHGSHPQYVPYSDRATEPSTNPTTSDQLQRDRFLLGSTPDAVLIQDLHSLNNLIQQHTESHYHTKPVQLDSGRLCQPLKDLGIEKDSTSAIEKLVSLALDPRTRFSAIRYVIAKAAFESTVIGGSTCISLLPPLLSGLSLAMPSLGDHSGVYEGLEFAIARWRQLTAYLLHPNRSQGTSLVLSEGISTQEAQKLTVLLNKILEPFVSGDREGRYEQENNLREVIVECATFGYVLLSQPYDYRFRFESESEPNTLVVCPGLDKLIDEEGRCYQVPLPQIVAPVVEAI
ncbi:hypothetical protein O1611_g2787 [Lasiodiplodia mahajangana]|uniref:Uncharacterized protein n=1 Tax=Lasiodiplodia mahajangana TaxID=1108764 RepID=A0ACC2JUH1_9PEZI|nr:hypothetical protein O1611_g2787 [Lasiodiplodia mahajangana]